jgi:hypothetical protein
VAHPFTAMPEFVDRVKAAFFAYVTTKAALGIYDPLNPRRPQVPVVSFNIEYLEIDDDMTAHAAGTVILQGPNGDVEKFLRVSASVTADGGISPDAEIRAAYIEETNPALGACKETAAFANV